jgi:hypothetical protein
VLLAGGATIQTVAIPWLHVIREHPTFLAQYTNLFDRSRQTQSIMHFWQSTRKTLVGHANKVVRTFQNYGGGWFSNNKMENSIDYLFVSHLLSFSQSSQSYDFYFGNVPDQLAAQGFSVAIALINHTSQTGSAFVNQWGKNAVTRIILSQSLSFHDEVDIYQKTKIESKRLRKEGMRQKNSLLRRVYFRGAEEALSTGTVGALRVATQIGRLVAQTKTKTLVVTHEGHSWERTVFSAARQAYPSVHCIGYQHAAVFRLQHALRRNLSNEYNPDQIITAGLVGKKQLKEAPQLQQIPISVLGSSRAISQKKRTQSTKKRFQKKSMKDSVCLVLPEGIPSECHYLFDFSIACSKAFPKIKFIWRLHPIVDYKKLCSENCQLNELPPGIIISNKSLVNDFARSDIVLYRGTTAAIQAIAAGLKPIYFQAKGEMSIDPLFEMNSYIEKVGNVNQFGEVIKARSSAGKKISNKKKLRNYAKAFFAPLDATCLIRGKTRIQDSDN